MFIEAYVPFLFCECQASPSVVHIDALWPCFIFLLLPPAARGRFWFCMLKSDITSGLESTVSSLWACERVTSEFLHPYRSTREHPLTCCERLHALVLGGNHWLFEVVSKSRLMKLWQCSTRWTLPELQRGIERIMPSQQHWALAVRSTFEDQLKS
jgi:hypothetical protein